MPLPPRLRRIVRRVVRGLLACALLLVLYVVGFWALGLVPVNTDYRAPASGIEVWVTSNGLHTEFVVPVQHPVYDWTADVPYSHFPVAGTWCSHVAFGWGDRGFFLEARTLADVRVTTALQAMSYTGRSALHVIYTGMPVADDDTRRLLLTEAQYRRLVGFIRASFARDAAGRTQPIAGQHYFGSDAFYEGVGSYGLFYTCNTWTNEALRELGVRTAAYAVFAGSVMRHL